jgi:hypothetical protein
MRKILEPEEEGGSVRRMPWPQPERLTEAQERRLRAQEARVYKDEALWAKMVREYGVSASARSYGIQPSSMLKRVQRIEKREG